MAENGDFFIVTSYSDTNERFLLCGGRRDTVDRTQSFELFESLDQSLDQPSPLSPYGRLQPLAKQEVFQKIELVEECTNIGRAMFSYLLESNSTIYWSVSAEHIVITRDFGKRLTLLEDRSKNGTRLNGVLLPPRKAVPLVNGDTIGFTNLRCSAVFTYEGPVQEAVLPGLELANKYRFTECDLGRGSFGKVILGKSIVDAEHLVAIKVVEKSLKRKVSDIADNSKEVYEAKVMQQLSHPNCVGVEDCELFNGRTFIVMEYVAGGDLQHKIAKAEYRNRGLGEPLMIFYAYQLLSAVQYLHSLHICHRDIKLENILLVSDTKYPVVKLTDFGFATRRSGKMIMETYCGTPCYMPPELFQSPRLPYDNSVDIWSLGCVLFTTCVGYPPFSDGYLDMDLKSQILKGRLILHSEWETVSSDTIFAIKLMLQVDPTLRPSASELLNLFWMNDIVVYKAKSVVANHQKWKEEELVRRQKMTETYAKCTEIKSNTKITAKDSK